MTPKSTPTSSPHSPADTLRAMAKSYAWKEGDDYSQEITACEAGAAAWEIVSSAREACAAIATLEATPEAERTVSVDAFYRQLGEFFYLKAQTLVQPR